MSEVDPVLAQLAAPNVKLYDLNYLSNVLK